MDFILIDSDVLIEVLRQSAVATAELLRARTAAPLAVSVITRMEIVVGSNNRESLQRTEKLLRTVRVLPLNEEISAAADALVTQFHLSHGMRLADALIAATALVYDVPLLSRNQRDFRFIPGLKLLPYPPAAPTTPDT